MRSSSTSARSGWAVASRPGAGSRSSAPVTPAGPRMSEPRPGGWADRRWGNPDEPADVQPGRHRWHPRLPERPWSGARTPALAKRVAGGR